MTEIRIRGPRGEVDEALREVLYGSSKFSIRRVEDGPLAADSERDSLAGGDREIVLDYPRPR